jgi:hypothetical protein
MTAFPLLMVLFFVMAIWGKEDDEMVKQIDEYFRRYHESQNK